jgi:hypothetical protein
MAVITTVILIEKVAPRADVFAKVAGAAMVTAGIGFIAVNMF